MCLLACFCHSCGYSKNRYIIWHSMQATTWYVTSNVQTLTFCVCVFRLVIQYQHDPIFTRKKLISDKFNILIIIFLWCVRYIFPFCNVVIAR